MKYSCPPYVKYWAVGMAMVSAGALLWAGESISTETGKDGAQSATPPMVTQSDAGMQELRQLAKKAVSALSRTVTAGAAVTETELPVLQDRAQKGDVKAMYRLGTYYGNGLRKGSNYKEGAEWYRKAAAGGDAKAMYQLAWCYNYGVGLEKNADEAAKWYRSAAEAGYADAMLSIGMCYEGGWGVQEDREKATHWYLKAAEAAGFPASLFLRAERGEPEAQTELGFVYYGGKGVAIWPDPVEAAKWWRKAAEQGNVAAQSRLAMAYSRGEGLEKDAGEAVKWWRKAAEQGDATAQMRLADAYRMGKGVERSLGEAIEWCQKAVEQKQHGRDVGAESVLIDCYVDMALACTTGGMVEKNSAEAVRWWRKAADQGSYMAQCRLAYRYAEGDGVEKDLAEAAKWFRKAADQGYCVAQCRLGYSYAWGEGVPQDYAEAAKWFRKAADQGYYVAQCRLGDCYVRGEGVSQDYAEAVKWFRKAADQGDASAQYNLGVAHSSGEGAPKDHVEAVKWFRKAAEQGDAAAQYNIAGYYWRGEGVLKDVLEALAWANLAAISGNEKFVKRRTALEGEVGVEGELLAQKRSKELLREIEARKASNVAGAAHGASPESAAAPNPLASGSGVAISPDLVLTVAHVVDQAKRLVIITATGRFDGQVVARDTANDIVLLRVGKGSLKAVPVIPCRGVKLGQSVFTVGFPNVDLQGFSPKMTKGEISSLNGIQDDPRQWQISVPVQPGNSGGPLFDEAGNVIGIVVAKLHAGITVKVTGALPENVNYAVKSAYVLPLLDPYADTLPKPTTAKPGARLEDVVAAVQSAAVMVLAY